MGLYGLTVEFFSLPAKDGARLSEVPVASVFLRRATLFSWRTLTEDMTLVPP